MVNRRFCKKFLITNNLSLLTSIKPNKPRRSILVLEMFFLEICYDESCRVYKRISFYVNYNRGLQMRNVVRYRFLYFIFVPNHVLF